MPFSSALLFLLCLMHYPSKRNYIMFDFKAPLFLHYSRSILLEVELNTLAGTTGFNKKGHFTDKANSMNSLTRRDEEITLFSRKQILPLAGALQRSSCTYTDRVTAISYQVFLVLVNSE